MRPCLRFLGLLIAMSLWTGCQSNPGEFAAFAEAGIAYTGAVDDLLHQAGEAEVNATSWQLVSDKLTADEVGDDNFDSAQASDRLRLQTLQRLQKHAQLLGRYFARLRELATSDTPDDAEKATRDIFDELKGISSALGQTLPDGAEIIAPIVKLAVEARISEALRAELQAREAVIRKELLLQAAVLKVLEEQMLGSEARARLSREDTLLERLNEKVNSGNAHVWVRARNELMLENSGARQVAAARRAALRMEEAFQKLLRGEVSMLELEALMEEWERINR